MPAISHPSADRRPGRGRLVGQLALAFLALALLLVGVLAGTLSWMFARGFQDHLQRLEQQRLDPLARVLVETYAHEGGWHWLREDPALWRVLTRGFSPPAADSRGPPRGPIHSPRGPRGPHGRPPPPGRLALLDADRRPVIGAPQAPPDALWRPLEHQGATVGWLRLVPLRAPLEDLDEEFRRRHLQVIAFTALAALVLALAIAIPLARHLVGPVRQLTRGMAALTAGRFETRLHLARRDELGELAQGFNRTAAVLEENERLRRRWVADISHELRTPLSILTGEVDALAEGIRPWNDQTRASLQAEVAHLAKLVEDLHQLALSDLGALTYQRQPMELEPWLAALVARHEPDCQAAGLRLDWDPEPRICRILGDPQRLTQLFANLLQNSLRYTDAGGRIRLCTRRAGNQVRILLEDSAPGVPEEALGHLFERLYRVDQTRRRARGGSGLGLAICHNIVTAHEGEITAQASPLGGLRMILTLPLMVSP